MYRNKGNTQGPRQKIRKTIDRKLAEDITASILLHAEHGIKRTAEFYTMNANVISMVNDMLEGEKA